MGAVREMGFTPETNAACASGDNYPRHGGGHSRLRSAGSGPGNSTNPDSLYPEWVEVNKEVITPGPYYVGEPITYEITLTYHADPSLYITDVELNDSIYPSVCISPTPCYETKFERVSVEPVGTDHGFYRCFDPDPRLISPVCHWFGPLYGGESVSMRVTIIPQNEGMYGDRGQLSALVVDPARQDQLGKSWAFEEVFVQVVEKPKPTTKAQCKNGGFAQFGFADQGACIEYVNANR